MVAASVLPLCDHHSPGNASDVRAALMEMRDATREENLQDFINETTFEPQWRAKAEAWLTTLTEFEAQLSAGQDNLGRAVSNMILTVEKVLEGSFLRQLVTIETGQMHQEIESLEQALNAATSVVPVRPIGRVPRSVSEITR